MEAYTSTLSLLTRLGKPQKKSSSLIGRAIKRGTFFSNVPTAIKLEGGRGGGLGLNGPAIKRINFFAASLREHVNKTIVFLGICPIRP